MANYRSAADRVIDKAWSAIADAESRLMHSFTPDDIAAAEDELADARRDLARAEAAKAAWNAVEHDDYEEYPDVPRHAQESLL